MLNCTSSGGWSCHWKTCGALGFSTDRSLIYCAMVATCGSSVGSPAPLPRIDRVLVGHVCFAFDQIWEICGLVSGPEGRALRWATSSRINRAQWRVRQRSATRALKLVILAVLFETPWSAHYVAVDLARIGFASLTVIVILALVALFIGLRLYSVLGERTGHEQQPILKPADPEAMVEPRVNQPSVVQPSSATDGGDMAYLADRRPGRPRHPRGRPGFDVARFLEGAKSAYRMVLEAYWKGDLEPMQRACRRACVRDLRSARPSSARRTGLTLDNRLVAIEQARDRRSRARARPSRLSRSASRRTSRRSPATRAAKSLPAR